LIIILNDVMDYMEQIVKYPATEFDYINFKRFNRFHVHFTILYFILVKPSNPITRKHYIILCQNFKERCYKLVTVYHYDHFNILFE
jgi:hypothetical protein